MSFEMKSVWNAARFTRPDLTCRTSKGTARWNFWKMITCFNSIARVFAKLENGFGWICCMSVRMDLSQNHETYIRLYFTFFKHCCFLVWVFLFLDSCWHTDFFSKCFRADKAGGVRAVIFWKKETVHTHAAHWDCHNGYTGLSEAQRLDMAWCLPPSVPVLPAILLTPTLNCPFTMVLQHSPASLVWFTKTEGMMPGVSSCAMWLRLM